jgi:acyl dehydratase
VDVDKAKDGPFGGTIAHGYLTLSLIPQFTPELFSLETPGAKLNYGVNKVRFPSPVPVGSKVRATATLADVTEFQGGLQLTLSVAVEREGGDKPVCIAEPIYRYYGG